MKPHGKIKTVLERKYSMSFATIDTAVGICPTSTYTFLTNNLGKPKVCAKYITCSTMTKEPCVFLPPPICGVGEMKAMHFWIVFKRLASNGCINLTLSWNDRMLKGMPESHRERKLHCVVKLLWKSCTSCSSTDIDFYLTVPCQFVRWWVTNVTAHCCKRLGWLFDIKKRNSNWCRSTSGPWNTSSPPWCAKSGGTSGLGSVYTSSLIPDLVSCECWLFACVKEHVWDKRFQSEGDNNAAVTASLHRLNKNEHRAATDRLHTDGKRVWTVRVITLSRGLICEHCGMSIVLWSCLL
jgi:hypothetical protein